MTTNNHKTKHYNRIEPSRLIDMLDEKSLNVLRQLGHDVDNLKKAGEIKAKMPIIINRIERYINKVDQSVAIKIKSMCYIGQNGNKTRTIVRPFKHKIIELYEYVINHPDFR